MEKTKKHLYLYAKERYLWEHSLKNELNSSVAIPLGILLVQITGFSYLFLNFPKKTDGRIFIVFIIFLILSVISIILSVVFFLRHQSGYKYAYIFSPKEMANYRRDYITAYTKADDNIDYDYIYNEIIEAELSVYIEATDKNILNNETKLKFYRFLLLSLIISTVFLVITLSLSLFLTKT
jgi:uncharacterized Tic20 family protein